MKIKKKINWEKIIKDEIFIGRLRLGALFVLGFLIGVMFKSQALRTIVSGYDDQKILKSDEIQIKQEVFKSNNENEY